MSDEDEACTRSLPVVDWKIKLESNTIPERTDLLCARDVQITDIRLDVRGGHLRR